jgi:S1-C subfamily serine protease
MMKKFFITTGLILSTVAGAFAQEKPAPAARTRQDNGRVVIQFQQNAQNTNQIIKPWVVSVVHKIDAHKMFRRLKGSNARTSIPDSLPEFSYNITTGAIIDENGYVVTRLVNIDPQDKEQSITVITNEGTSLPAQFVGLDCPSGFAILLVPALKLATPASAAQIEQDKLVKILSTDLTQQTTTAVDRQAQVYLTASIKSLSGKIDTNSLYAKARGALTLRSAKLLSRNDSAVVTTVDDQLVGMAQYAGVGRAYLYPIELIRNTIAKRVIEKKDSVPSGWLGVKGLNSFQLSTEEKAAFGGKIKAGVVVKEVTGSSPAAFGGVLPQDIIVGFNEFDVMSTGDLGALLASSPSGSKVKLRMIRNQAPLELDVELGARAYSEQLNEQYFFAQDLSTQAKSESAQIDDINRRLDELGVQYRDYIGAAPSQERNEALGELTLEIRELQERLRLLGADRSYNPKSTDPGFNQSAQTCTFKTGFTARALTAQLASEFGTPKSLQIINVIKGSAADLAGLLAGDVIVSSSQKALTCGELETAFTRQQGNRTLNVIRKRQPLSIIIKEQ